MDSHFETYTLLFSRLGDYLLPIMHEARRLQGKPKEFVDNADRIAFNNSLRSTILDAIRPILPAATQSTVCIVGSAQAIDNMIMFLASEDLKESELMSETLLREVRKVAAPFFERTDLPHRGVRTIEHRKNTRQRMEKLVRRFIPSEFVQVRTPDMGFKRNEIQINLLSYWPASELDIVPHLLFQVSDASYHVLESATRIMDDPTKREIISAYFGDRSNRRHKPGRALELVHYNWEMLADYGTFRDLQRHRMVDGMEWQDLTPYYGYTVPNKVLEAGVKQEFDSCFERSAELYEKLRAAGFDQEAQYATLLGHRMRYKWTINAREACHIHELRSQLDGHPGYRKIVTEMHAKVSAVHPTIASGMKFVNTREDPALVRLDSELATQRKLSTLDTADSIQNTK
jgi:thymidylate synthase ThyX